MDILERLFEKYSSWSLTKKKNRDNIFKVNFDDESTSLIALCCLSSEDPNILVREGQGIGFVTTETIFLPECIDYFKNYSLNRNIFLNKALVAGAILKYKISYKGNSLSPLERALQIIDSKELIINKLENDLPGYKLFYKNLSTEYVKNLESFPLSFYDQKFATRPTEELISLQKLEEIPPIAFALCTQLLAPSSRTDDDIYDFAANEKKTQKNKMTEVKGHSSPEVEMISLNKERDKENPVAHSFEKLETVDEYKGGYKTTDTSDELVQHSAALDELKLSKVTREGGAAQSVYKSSANDFFKNVVLKSQGPRYNFFKFYPEWNYKSKNLIKDHCRLYLISNFESQNTNSITNHFLANLEEKYHSEIKFWESKIWNIVNQRKIIDRQLDGSEINIDAFIRYVGDMRETGQGDPRLYLKSRLQERDFACLILLDQSLSTDSWVSNKRVLDLELESIGLIGLLLKDMKDSIYVAGTWSETKNHCYFQTYKTFKDPWSHFTDHVEQIEPQGYTRLGPSIRHSSELLKSTGAKKRLLILLTDGKPTDFDKYEGRYGIEDIKHAILECQQLGITVKALAIDNEAKNYFPFLFGSRDYQILSDPIQLPEKLFKIYIEAAMS